MTEQETMQGLRACWEYKDCSKCPFVLELNDCHSELAHEAYKTIERLRAENAELKARLEKAVDLPVKVGDTVWLIWYIHVSADAHLQCVEAKITDLMMMKDLVRYGAQEGDWCHEFTNDAIGEWVFTTREAAEARLAELKGGKHE